MAYPRSNFWKYLLKNQDSYLAGLTDTIWPSIFYVLVKDWGGWHFSQVPQEMFVCRFWSLLEGEGVAPHGSIIKGNPDLKGPEAL